MTAELGRSTGQPARAALFALRHWIGSGEPVPLHWGDLNLSARPTDWHGLREVLIEREYAALAPALIRGPEPVVLDLGANIGAFALFVFSLAPRAQVHSFEPAIATYGLLARNAAANPAVCWHTYRSAAWSHDGTVSFATRGSSTAGRITTEGDEIVPALSLTSIVERCGGRIDVAKIDVEGAEEALLADGAKYLSAIETLVVELHPERCDVARVVEALRVAYSSLYQIPGRRSSKPLILATRTTGGIDLPVYAA